MGYREAGKSANVFFVDDELLICKAVGQTLQEIPCTMRSFSRAGECIEALQGSACDLVISDVSMPEMDGMELLKAVKKMHPGLPVLLITGYGDIPLAVEAIKAGACDFIEKPLDEATFLPAVRAALDQNLPGEAGVELTAMEMQILKMIVEGKSNKEVAFSKGCSTRTVENHRYRLMHKLKVDSTAALVRTALGRGLVKG